MTAFDQILIVFAVVHAYVFSVLFFYTGRKSTSILGFFMFFTFFEYFLNVNMFYFGFEAFRPAFYYLVPFLTLIPMPILYLYVRYMATEKYTITKHSFLHFIPGVLALFIGVIILFSMPSEERSLIILQKLKEGVYYENIKLYFLITTIVLFAQAFAYSGVNLFQLIKHRSTVKDTYSYKEKISLNWLLIFVYFILAQHAYEFIVFILPKVWVSETVYYLVKLAIVLFVGVMGLRQREIYDKDKQILQNEEPQLIENTKKTKPISDELKIATANRIKIIMSEEKLFLQPDLSLYDLSKRLDMHKNYVSHIINDVFEANFFMFINRYRVEEAKRMLLDSEYDNLSIEGIASSVGFKSRNVFYPVFKKLVGMTPLQFKKQNK
ncbi:MAG: helix-turn-helix transcriptional regulator [Bacteroidales bacterium]|nr:helix-turn-helix transcriptional regulator [Bacteroidales bacterium]